MNKSHLVTAVVSVALSTGLVLAQAPGTDGLRSVYRVASVGGNGAVVREGTVVLILMDGIKATTPYGNFYWPNKYKAGRVGQRLFVPPPNFSGVMSQARFLQVKERAYVTGIELKSSDVAFRIQTIPADANESPYRAEVSFQFEKNSVPSMSAKQLQDAVGELFGVEEASTAQEPPAAATRMKTPPPPEPTVALKLPAVYTNAETPSNQIQLNADKTLSVQSDGQVYTGTFEINGNTLALTVNDAATTATIEGNKLTDARNQIWILKESAPGTGNAASALRNDDILKLVKAHLADSLILAKIASSPCRFDTSTDALIVLQNSGASTAVINAMLTK
ncbi:MAG TPA: hypothetical protein VMB03_34525 [Bryobacteraceae bacterium]|nr:hypothetical protein [Bryobacteraceae bacterium]